MTCPHCDYAAAYHGDRYRTLVGLTGVIACSRAYYYCRRCGLGLCPFDQQAGIHGHRLTPAAEQLATLAGVVGDSFDKASHLLAEMAGVCLSESTVERTTEDVGGRLAVLQSQGVTFGPDVRWRWHHDAKGRTVAYVTLDASGTRQQGPGGRHADGRMAYVGGVYNPASPQWLRPVGPAPPVQARYVSGLYSLSQMGPLLRYQATAVGMERAEIWIALSDGGNGLEELLQSHFNRADLVVILDFYHAASYLEALARAVHPDDATAAAQQAEQWCRLLKEEGGATTLALLRQWDWPVRKSLAWRAAWQALDSYFANNVHRMEYPEYVAEGWQIGSGVVESACKTVVGQRLKGAGKRWGEAGAHALCHVRALYRSEKGQWEAFWRHQYTQRVNVQQLK